MYLILTLTVLQVLLELLEALREEEEPAKVLLFSYSTALLDILEPFAQSLAYNYLRLDGKTRTESRQDLVEQFNTDPDVFLFLISTKAGGVGLNITGANVVIVFDPSWNPSNDLQAQDRAYRQVIQSFTHHITHSNKSRCSGLVRGGTCACTA